MRESLTEIDDLLVQSVQAARSLTAELSPAVLYEKGLWAALEWLSQWMRQMYRLDVTVGGDPQAEPDDEPTRLLLFGAIRELLFNVIKHAGVNGADVRLLRRPDGTIEIHMSDHGAGFDSRQLDQNDRPAEGFGLPHLRRHLQLLGGNLDVESTPGRGTTVTFTVATGLAALKPQERRQ